MQHIDLSLEEAQDVVGSFEAHSQAADQPAVLLATDAALRGVKTGLPVRLVVHYDAASSKEAQLRRQSLPAADRVHMQIHFVTAGELDAFRRVEGYLLPQTVQQMPVHAADLFRQAELT